MATVQNIFTSGRMDSDTDHSFTDEKSYRYALNLRPSGYGKDGTMTPIKGSQKISDYSEKKTMTVVGQYAGENNKLYTLLARQGGLSKIIETDIITKTDRVLIQDDTLLQFDLFLLPKNSTTKRDYILSIDQIEDLLFISSDKWEYPRVFNLKRDYSTSFILEDIILAKKPPKESPQIIDKKNNSYKNDDKNSFVSFTYRYKYLDNNYSALSFYSDTIFEPDGDGGIKINAKRENTTMVNKWDYVKLMVNSGGKNVTDIEVYAREHGSNTAYLIYSVNKLKSTIANNVDIMDIEYKFSKNYTVLNEQDTLMIFSNIPKFPKTQTVTGNRMFYANYKEGYDLEQQVDFTVANVKTTPNITNTRETAISLFKYKISAIYYNDFNESTTALLPLNQTKAEIEIPFADRFLNNNLQVTLLSDPPSFATKMKFAVNSQTLNYETIYTTIIRKSGLKLYIKIESENTDKIHKGDYIFPIDTGYDYKEYKVEEFKEYRSVDGFVAIDGFYAVITIDDDFVIDINTINNLNKQYSQEGIIDYVRNTPSNPQRFTSISGDGQEQRTVIPYSDYGAIKAGDSISIDISFRYGQHNTSDFFIFNPVYYKDFDFAPTIPFNFKFFAEKDYATIGDFIASNFTDYRFTVTKGTSSVNIDTNADYAAFIRDTQGSLYGWPGYRESVNDWKLYVHRESNINLIRGTKPINFRTRNKENLDEYYFETYKTYPIVNGKVIGDDNTGVNPIFNIGFYNGYCWGEGIESYKIKDNFNAKSLKYRFRPNQYDKKGYKRIHRKNDITYSALYNYELGINDLSVFNPMLANWKNLPVHFGAIQMIVSTDGDISVFCIDKVINQYYGKTTIFDLQGSENVATTNEVLGDYQVLPYTFGTQNPESVVKSVDGIYFVDKKRKRYLFKADRQIGELNPEGSGHNYKGVKEISEHNNFLATYNEAHGEWQCGLDHCDSIVFNPQAKGFSHYYNYSFDYISNMNGIPFTGYKGIIYQDEITDSYNTFAGGQNGDSILKYTVNNNLNSDKVFKALMLHSNTAWDVEIETNLTATSFGESAFTQKESFFYSEIYRDNATVQNSQGIGVVKSILGNVLTFSYPIGINISSGDKLISENNVILSEITDVKGKTITVANSANININDYLLAEKQSSGNFRPDGAPMRGKWMEVTLTKNDNELFYLTSVTTEVIQSKL